MAGTVRAPHTRWGGKWKLALERADVGEDWTELTDYARTSSYQVARALNLGRDLPASPEGQVFEFGARENIDGSSTLLVRLVDE